MIDYFENKEQTGVSEPLSSLGYAAYGSARFRDIIQPLIDAAEAQIVLYVDGPVELAEVINAKQNAVRDFYETRHGEPLASVVKRQAAAQPSVVTTANAITNIAIADGGIAAIAALIDKATVDAYSVAGLAWS